MMKDLFANRHLNLSFKLMVVFFVVFFFIKILNFENWFFQVVFPLVMSGIWFMGTLFLWFFLKLVVPEIHAIFFPEISLTSAKENQQNSSQGEGVKILMEQKEVADDKRAKNIFDKAKNIIDSNLKIKKKNLIKGKRVDLNTDEDLDVYKLYYNEKKNKEVNLEPQNVETDQAQINNYFNREEYLSDAKNKEESFTNEHARKIARQIKKILKD